MKTENIILNGIEYCPITPVINKLKDLKKAYSEGAIIEIELQDRYKIDPNPTFHWANMYRIKDNISIASWNRHKDVIQQFWNGVEIETDIGNTNVWRKLNNIKNISANANSCHYRVKQDKWKLPEYEWYASKGNPDLQVSRRRATKALAERCAKASKERDLLEAYRDHLEPDWIDPDWDNLDVGKYYIYLREGKYLIGYNFYIKSLGTVYGSEKTMQKICDALNTGEITLY